MQYIISEKQNRFSIRAGTEVSAENLTAAKCKATKMQFFQGTVLTIEDTNGNRLAVKENNQWGN